MSSYSLPLEIWQQIFTYACTDGGYTGTSLALISKFFYNASHPFRFHSLSFTTLQQIQSFLEYVDGPLRLRQKKAPKVYHLMLFFPSFSPSDFCPEYSQSAADTSNLCANVWVRARRLREEEKTAWDKRFSMVISRLLDLVALHLETLALLQSDNFIIPVIQHMLPNLRELTLLIGVSVMLNEGEASSPGLTGSPSHHPGESHPFLPQSRQPSRMWVYGQQADGKTLAAPATFATPSSGDAAQPPAACARFPGLERLHVVCGRHRDWTLRAALEHLPELAPALTHLRISNAAYTHGQDDYIPAFLHRALGVRRRAQAVPTSIEIDGQAGQGVTPSVSGHPADPGSRSSSAMVSALDAKEAEACGLSPSMPGLRYVGVHSVPPPRGCQYGAPYKDYRTLVDAVKAVASACDQDRAGDARVQWTESDRAQNRAWEQLIKAQWVDRCEGGRGCWEVDADAAVDAGGRMLSR